MLQNPAFRWLVATPFVVFLVLLATWDALFPPVAWRQPARKPGEPVVEMWVSAKFDACFDDAAVYQVADEKLRLFRWPDEARFDKLQVIVEPGAKLKFSFSEPEGFADHKSSIIFRDLGDRLVYERTEDGLDSQVFSDEDRPSDLMNCGAHNLKDRLKLLYKRPFELRSDA